MAVTVIVRVLGTPLRTLLAALPVAAVCMALDPSRYSLVEGLRGRMSATMNSWATTARSRRMATGARRWRINPAPAQNPVHLGTVPLYVPRVVTQASWCTLIAWEWYHQWR